MEDSFFTFLLGLLPAVPGAMSDEHGKRFRQDFSAMEKRYAGKS